MSFTNNLEAELLDHIFTDGAYSPPATLYIGLSTSTPTEAGGNISEPSGNGYDRKSVAAADMDAAVEGGPSSKDNGSELAFDQATGSWGTVTHFVVFTASSGGTALMFGSLTTSKTIDNGDVARFSAGDFEITLE